MPGKVVQLCFLRIQVIEIKGCLYPDQQMSVVIEADIMQIGNGGKAWRSVQ